MTLQVAVIGIDGSGKSTLARALPMALSAELGAVAASVGDDFWVAFFDSAYVLGRRKAVPSCHAITGSLEALLRWAGLANSWMVQEIECGCVTGTNDCVFTISSAKVH